MLIKNKIIRDKIGKFKALKNLWDLKVINIIHHIHIIEFIFNNKIIYESFFFLKKKSIKFFPYFKINIKTCII